MIPVNAPFGPRWRPVRSPKHGPAGAGRVVPPRCTVARASRVMSIVGVTRVADVTGLDRIGIPNFMAVRPRDLGPGISYYNGKGVTRAAAMAGAMMEAIERYSGERCDWPSERGTFAAMRRRGPAVDPADLIVPRTRPLDDALVLEWVRGWDLLCEEPVRVPLNAVVCPYEPRDAVALFYASTNGLAAGNTIEEALCQAMCEVIERDALALALTSLELRPAVDAVLTAVGVRTASHGPSSPASRFPLLALDDLPRAPAALVRRFRAANLTLYVRDCTAASGIPMFDCTVVEPRVDGCFQVHGGCGCHPDACVALTRALTEAAQSRVACVQGGREDLPEIVKPPSSFDPAEIYGAGETRRFSSVPSRRHATVDDDLRFLLAHLRNRRFTRVIAINLTRPEVRVPVVRVVVPGAEAWTVFHLHTGRGVFGSRVADLLRQEVDVAAM